MFRISRTFTYCPGQKWRSAFGTVARNRIRPLLSCTMLSRNVSAPSCPASSASPGNRTSAFTVPAARCCRTSVSRFSGIVKSA